MYEFHSSTRWCYDNSHQIYKEEVKSDLLFKIVVVRSSLYRAKYCIWNFDYIPKGTASTKVSLNTEIFLEYEKNVPHDLASDDSKIFSPRILCLKLSFL